jgi:hypothetical protein
MIVTSVNVRFNIEKINLASIGLFIRFSTKEKNGKAHLEIAI